MSSKRSDGKLSVWAASLAAGVLLMATPAHAFSEDVCLFYVPPQEQEGIPRQVYYHPFNCNDLQCLDGADGGSCFATGLRQYLGAVLAGAYHARSTLHYDVPFLYARLAGLDETQALALAAHGESVDLGSFQAMQRDAVVAGQKQTATLASRNSNINGLVRTNGDTLGFWAHFVPWFRPGGSSLERSEVTPLTYDAAYELRGEPSPLPATERPLNHLRRWAFTQGTQVCQFGLADGQGACLGQSLGQSLYFWLPAPDLESSDSNVAADGSAPLFWQEVHDRNSLPNEEQYAETDAALLAGKPTGLGAYLHVLADRISHNQCLDSTFIEQVAHDEDEYRVIYNEAACGTVGHAALHYMETGHGTNTPPRTRQALELQLREMLDWGRRNQLTATPPVVAGYYPVKDPRFIEDMVARVTSAIGEPCANKRLAALCSIARAYGVRWHDGNTDCVYPSYPGDAQCQ
jgi:hypothetical protein